MLNLVSYMQLGASLQFYETYKIYTSTAAASEKHLFENIKSS